jgi:hypothetical protein
MGGGWTAGAMTPPSAMLRLTARSNDFGALSGFAFRFAWPGACIFAPTNATPSTSSVPDAMTAFAPRARVRARSIRESCFLAIAAFRVP